MNKPTAAAGWSWVKQGFALFRRQPLEMLTLFFAYMFLNMAIGFIPVAGDVLPFILLPVFSMSFMFACRDIEANKRVMPHLLISGFRLPSFKNLAVLGLLYLLTALLALAASTLVDGGHLWDLFMNQKTLDAETMADQNLALGMLFACLVSTPALMAFWYAGPLIAWQQMSVGKALFYSFFAVKNSGKAFTVYGLSWIGIVALLPALISTLLAAVVGNQAALVVVIPIYFILMVVMYCSFYPSYTDVFGQPGSENLPTSA
jgi:hypothetical protein